MPGFLTVSAEADLNTIRTTAPEYMHNYMDLTKKNHMLLSMMGGWGNIIYNANSLARIWQIQVREANVRTHTNSTNKTFSEHDPFEQMQVGVRGYEATDVFKELDWKLNQGSTQLIDMYDFKTKHIAQTMVKRIQEWLYRDGDTTTYADGYQGFESCLHVKNANNGGSAPTNADLLVLTKDTYGGHSTELGNFGGSYSADLASADRYNHLLSNDWPFGQGSPEYDALSPKLFNYEATRLGTGSNEWADNVEDVIRHAIAVFNAQAGSTMTPEEIVFLLANDLYPAAENYYSDRFRIMQQFSGGDMGYAQRHSIQIDGAHLKADYAVPAGLGYIVCPKYLEMFNLITMNGGGPEPMIDVFGPDWSPEHGAYLFRCTTFGNLRMSPKYMGKLAPLAHYVDAAA